MPQKGGNKESAAGYSQEWQASYSGSLPGMQHESIQNRTRVIQ
jgi:hypothetical protein